MAGLFVTLFAGLIGLGLFMYGRSNRRAPQLGVGLALMVCPQFIDGTLAIVGMTLGGVALMTLLIRAGA